MTDHRVGLLGATSLVGKCLIHSLINSGARVFAFSRRQIEHVGDNITWRNLSHLWSADTDQLDYWLCVAPIWVMPEHFPLLEASGARRIVMLSSTSCFTKVGSGDAAETAVAARLIEAEDCVVAWAKSRDVEWVILRPTLIYGLGRDKNISEIAHFIRRFNFFPVFGQANGLRQPVHAQDVANACIAALVYPAATNHAYNLTGGETLTYREMVIRIFGVLDRPVRLLPVPLIAFRFAVSILRFIPRYRNWSSAMAERMNSDLVFDHSEATRDFGFKPRPFLLNAEDVDIK